jgi:uncharacterized protein (TIGR02147 family)
MTKKYSIFEFKDYKAYVRSFESQLPKGGRGFRAQIARTCGCQLAYVSQVLNNSANFSLEQAVALNELFGHSRDESTYFLHLIEYTRAGSPKLKTHFLELMNELLKKQLNLKDLFKVKEALTQEDQVIYYSEWFFSAVHILVTIPKFQSSPVIAEALGIPETKILAVLRFLLKAGLVVEDKGRYKIGNARVHVGSDSPLLSKHHLNWRLRSMEVLHRDEPSDLRYTSVISVSEDDILKLKARLVKEIEAFNAIVKDSKEEQLQCLTLDFFNVQK